MGPTTSLTSWRACGAVCWAHRRPTLPPPRSGTQASPATRLGAHPPRSAIPPLVCSLPGTPTCHAAQPPLPLLSGGPAAPPLALAALLAPGAAGLRGRCGPALRYWRPRGPCHGRRPLEGVLGRAPPPPERSHVPPPPGLATPPPGWRRPPAPCAGRPLPLWAATMTQTWRCWSGRSTPYSTVTRWGRPPPQTTTTSTRSLRRAPAPPPSPGQPPQVSPPPPSC